MLFPLLNNLIFSTDFLLTFFYISNMNTATLLQQQTFTRQDLIDLLSIDNETDFQLLMQRAFEVRKEIFGNDVLLRGIIEFSNYCRLDCTYCGIRASNKQVTRYRMTHDEIISLAGAIANANIGTIVLQSGEDLSYTADDVARIIRSIKERFDVAITLSLGERDRETYNLWRAAGADRYLLKHETANDKLYESLHPQHSLASRVEHLRWLKDTGFQTGSGNIIGIPGQTIEDIADDLILCNDIDVDMASFSPFIHAENTPLAEAPNADLKLTLKVMAIARMYLRNVHIPATTALSTLHPEGRAMGLQAGANVIMPTFTPNNYRFNYLIYENKPGGSEDPTQKLDDLYALLTTNGLKPSGAKGHSLKMKEK